MLAAKAAEGMKTATRQWGPCAIVTRSPRQGAARAVVAKAHFVKKVHHVLADPDEKTREVDPEEETRKVPLDPEEKTWEVPLDPEEETRPQRGDTGGAVGPRRGDIGGPSYPAEETREAPSDHENEVQGTPLDPEEETLEAPLDPEEETLEAPSDPEEETKYVAGLAEGPTGLDGLVVPARRKLTVSGNLPPNNAKAHVESEGARRRGRSSTANFSADERGRRLRQCVDVRRRRHDDFSEESGAVGADSEGRITGAVNRQYKG